MLLVKWLRRFFTLLGMMMRKQREVNLKSGKYQVSLLVKEQLLNRIHTDFLLSES